MFVISFVFVIFTPLPAESVLYRAVVEVLHHEGSRLACQSVIEQQIAVAHLVEYRDEVALAVGGAVGGLHGAHVGDDAVGADDVVVDVARYAFYQAVVAYGDIAQRGVGDARVLYEAFAYLHRLVECSEPDVAVEHHAMEEAWLEILRHLYALPVLRPASVGM